MVHVPKFMRRPILATHFPTCDDYYSSEGEADRASTSGSWYQSQAKLQLGLMSMTFPLESHVRQAWPPHRWRHKGIIVAVSGGPDSVALLRALQRLNESLPQPTRLTVAHFHHGWRGATADEDARFVRELAAELGIPHVEGTPAELGPPRANHALGPEGRARQQRYDFLLRAAHRSGARYVATGHSADDQVETVLHRILRGTGLRGLRGIPRRRRLGPDVSLVRPLLTVRRGEIEQYLKTLGQAVRHDESNESTRYLRNRIRRELLPELRESYNADVDRALLRLSSLAEEMASWLEELTDQAWNDCVREEQAADLSRRVSVRRAGFRLLAPYLARELLVEMWRRQSWPLHDLNQEALRELARLVTDRGTETIRVQAPGGVDVRLSEDIAEFHRLGE
jgi:tRNA(Ile)-lysidine synthase